MTIISTIAFILLIISWIIQVVFLLRKENQIDPVSHFILIVSALLLLAVTVVRSIQINFVALTNTYESLVFFSGGIALVLAIYRIRNKERTLPF
ncbi:MAG TPA: cytochrome C biogenesis protein, partial [Spirochaetes bacterium]|nr:cytochrome C biogenesis protein [Spirochaetota bacterium]